MNTTPQRLIRPRSNTKTPQGDHPELFIPRKISSASKRLITPSKLTNKLQGLYLPDEIHNQAAELSNCVSRATNESDESINAKLDVRAVEIASSFAKVVELVMWNDQPKKRTTIKRRVLRRRVAKKLEFPPDCFDRGPWAEKSRGIIDAEVVSRLQIRSLVLSID